MFTAKSKKENDQQNETTHKPTVKQAVEALLFYTAKQMTVKEISSISGYKTSEVKDAIRLLQEDFNDRGVSIIDSERGYLMTTSVVASELIQSLQKDEAEKPLSKAALETLSIVLYQSPVTRVEIDYIRGVNSTYSLRNLMIRGLIVKKKDAARTLYVPSAETMQYMGITKQEELVDFDTVQNTVQEIFKKQEEEEKTDKQEEANN